MVLNPLQGLGGALPRKHGLAEWVLGVTFIGRTEFWLQNRTGIGQGRSRNQSREDEAEEPDYGKGVETLREVGELAQQRG